MPKSLCIYIFSTIDRDVFSERNQYAPDDNLELKYFDNSEELIDALIERRPDLVIVDSKKLDKEHKKLMNLMEKAEVTWLDINISKNTSEIENPRRMTITDDGTITVRRKEEVSRREKLTEKEFIARIGATLSHELNNPLLAISANIEILLKNYSFLSDDIQEKLRQIEKSAERIRAVTEKFMELEDVRYRRTPVGTFINLDEILSPEPIK